MEKANALCHEVHAGLCFPLDWQTCPVHRFYRNLGLGSICWLWGQIQVSNSEFITGNLEPLMKTPINTALQVEELRRTHFASKLTALCTPRTPATSCHHHWTTEDPGGNRCTKRDAAKWHSREKRIGGKTNETIPDGQIRSAPTVNVLADCLSMVWNADKNIGLLSLANVNKSIFPNCFSSSISLSSYLLCYRKTAAELKEELNILHLELYDKSENFSGDALHKHFFLSNKWGMKAAFYIGIFHSSFNSLRVMH